jgi:hypothetical protein
MNDFPYVILFRGPCDPPDFWRHVPCRTLREASRQLRLSRRLWPEVLVRCYPVRPRRAAA